MSVIHPSICFNCKQKVCRGYTRGDPDQMVAVLRREKYENLLKGISPNVDVYKGRGKFTSRNHVTVTTESGRELTIAGRTFLIATGSSPIVPQFEGIQDVNYWTNVEALSPPFYPRSLIIVGGRALGLGFDFEIF